MKTNGVNVGFVFPPVPTRPPTPVQGDYSLILFKNVYTCIKMFVHVYAKAVTVILGHNFLLVFDSSLQISRGPWNTCRCLQKYNAKKLQKGH